MKISRDIGTLSGGLMLLVVFCCLTTTGLAQKSLTDTAETPPVADTGRVSLLQPVTVETDGLDSADRRLTLQQCIEYAFRHQPALNISQLNISVTKATNRIDLAGALPQASASGDLIHFLKQSSNGSGYVSSTGNTTASSKGGNTYTFVPGISVSQAIFNPGLLYAYRSAPLYLKQANEISDSTKIGVIASVSKSFYSLLLTLEQINVLKEDTARLGKSMRDAYHQYVGGIVDETDYEQASISLNNSKAQLKQANENVIPQYAALKALMGYPPDKQFNVVFDTLQMMKDIHIDTTQQLQFEKRIEFQLLSTNKSLQDRQVSYYKYSFLPTLSAFYNYNFSYQSSGLSTLFDKSYPTSLVGLSINIPIFTGFYRINNLRRAKLQDQIIGWEQTGLKSRIYTEYTSALASYKGNYYNLQQLQKNVTMAKRVYFVVTLQYRQGVIPYLNVITAESNLITSEISYLNALFQVLSNKIDLEKAMGNISY